MAKRNSGQSDGVPISEKRRRLLASLGAVGAPMVAGCLGDDEGNGGNGDDSGNGDTDTPGNGDTDTPGNGDDETPTETDEDGMERHDHTVEIYRSPPVPADAQFNPYVGEGGAMPSIAVGAGLRHDAIARSFADQQMYGDMVEDWQYQPGVLEFTLHDDFYFWDGTNIDADAWMATYEFDDYWSGGEEFNHDPNVVEAQKIDDYTIRYTLADAWNEDYALQQTINMSSVTAATHWHEEWNEQFRDAGNYDEVEDIRAEIGETFVHDPNVFYNVPFMMTGSAENYWEAELRTEDVIQEQGFDYPEPHYVDEINFTNVRWYAVEETATRSTEAFRNQNTPHNSQTSDFIDPETLDFATRDLPYERQSSALGWLFNCSSPPSSNVHFRRAWDYMTNREAFLRPYATGERHGTSPYLTDDREETFVSEEVRENFTDYSWDTAEFEKAEEEMERGGFERDSDGNWLFQEGDRAGEPMEWEIWLYSHQGYIMDHGGQFMSDMEEFGINLEWRQDDALWMRQRADEFIVDTSYIGGGIPVLTMGQTFGDDAISGSGNPQPPDTFEAPPVGTPWEEADELQTYETAAMANQLSVTTDEEQYQQIADELAWVANQTVPRAPVYALQELSVLNTEQYNIPTQEERPDLHLRLPYARLYQNGGVEYVPEDER